MRIFISYSHDYSEEIYRIAADLETCGYEVWIDINEIQEGCDWRECITNGILDSDIVLAFLSEYGLREDGVCRDEISIAVSSNRLKIRPVLLEKGIIGLVPASISSIQALDLSEWRLIPDEQFENWYGEVLNKVKKLCDEDFSLTVRQLEYLKTRLKTQEDNSVYEVNTAYLKRNWLNKIVNDWVQSDESQACILIGYPGFGKTFFSVNYFRECVEGIGLNICEWNKKTTIDTSFIIRNMALQIAIHLPDYRSGLVWKLSNMKMDLFELNALELFDFLIANPLMHIINGGHFVCLLMIDGLDECMRDGVNELADIISKRIELLPDFVKIFITSRNNGEIINRFPGCKLIRPVKTQAEVREDLKTYIIGILNKIASNMSDSEREICVDKLLDKSAGSFLYVSVVLNSLLSGELTLYEIERFPSKLNNVYLQWMRRLVPEVEFDDKYYDVFAALAYMKKMPVWMLEGISGWRAKTIREFYKKFSAFFVEGTNLFGEKTITFTNNFCEWLTSEQHDSYFVSVNDGGKIVAAYLYELYEEEELRDSSRFYGIPIFLAYGKRKWLKTLAKDMQFLQDIYLQINQMQADGSLYGEWHSYCKKTRELLSSFTEENPEIDVYARKFLYLEAYGEFLVGDYYKAERLLTDLVDEFSKLKIDMQDSEEDSRLYMETLYMLGTIDDWQGKREKSVTRFLYLLDLSTKQMKTAYMLKAMLGLIWNDHFNDLNAAMNRLQKMESIEKEEEDVFVLDLMLARVNLSMGNLDSAMEIYGKYLTMELDFFSEYDIVSRKKQMMFLETLVCCYDNAEYEKAIHFGESIFDKIKGKGDVTECYCLSWIGLNALRCGNVQNAMLWIDAAHAILQRQEQEESSMWIFMHLTSARAFIDYHNCDFEHSLEKHKLVMEYANDCDDAWVLGDACFEILSIFLFQEGLLPMNAELKDICLGKLEYLADKTGLPHLKVKYQIMQCFYSTAQEPLEELLIKMENLKPLPSTDYLMIMFFCMKIAKANAMQEHMHVFVSKMLLYLEDIKQKNSKSEIKNTALMQRVWMEVGQNEL